MTNKQSNKLTGKVAVVTEASKGIGAAFAKQLAAEGAAVVVNYSSSKTDEDKVVGGIMAQGGNAIAVQANVSRQAEIERLFAKTKEAFARLDILVDNAGVYEFSPLENVTEEHFHKQFNLNVLGLILATQAAAKLFDVEILRIPPGKVPYPYHSHSAQWEFYHVISGNGSVRHRDGTAPIEAVAAFVFKPGEPHQLINPDSGSGQDLLLYVVADNPFGESVHYPDSKKWGVRSPERRILRGEAPDYYDGEE